MAQPVVSRTQRRIERKQVVLIAILILAVAGISFALGVMFGQRGGPLSGLVADAEKPKLPMVVQVPPPPPPATTVEPAPEKQDKLTFYETLPKGNQAPLGSGINLPPAEKKPAVASKPKVVAKPAQAPQAKAPKSTVSPAAVSSSGAFVVQIASFRTSEDADKLAQRLKSSHLTPYVEAANLGNKGVWHRSCPGPMRVVKALTRLPVC